IAIALPLITTFNSYGAFLIGKKAFRTFFAYSSAVSIVYYACILIAVLYYPSALILVLVNLAITALGAFILYMVTLRSFKPAAQDDPDLLTYGKHLTLMNMFTTVASQLDNVLVFHFLGPAQLATYSFATLIPEKLSGFLKNLTNSALPRFAEQRFSEIRAQLLRNASLLALAIFIGILFYISVLPFFFSFVYPRYLDAVTYSQIFSLTLLAAVGNYVGTSLLAHRRIRRLYALNTLGPIAQLAAQVIGILFWGLLGLVIARVLWTFFFILISIPLVTLEPKAKGHFDL
ncbi:MAG TPA: oligosaccharide flippase family protein, partial [Candidatus Paceibacterota bacterium]|nr:oligosaccharide flippase family protein [Candidatus Paceibacterota bacterium]